MKIMVVDDNDDSRVYLERGLSSQGYSVKTVGNGKDAIKSAENWHPDLIITDVMMPEMDGFELCRKISEHGSLIRIPIIIYTATFVDSKDEKLALSLGASRFLIKPLDLSDLTEIIKKVMEEFETRQLPVTTTTVEDKQMIYDDYRQALAGKLEKKVRELEEEHRALKTSEEKYCRLIETAQDAILCYINGIIVDWNKYAERVFGYSKDEIIGKPVNILVPDRLKKEYQEGLGQFVNPGESRIVGNTVEVSGLTKEGVEIPIEISLTYQKIENEQRLCTAIIRDITERKKAEEQICKLSHAIEQSSSTIVITDTKGKIEYANPRFTQLTGYTHEEAIGKNPRVLKSGKTSPEVYKELWKTIQSGNEWRGEFCNKKKNGELYWEAASISPVKDDKGVITNFIAVKDDITERKEVQEQLYRQSNVLNVISKVFRDALLCESEVELARTCLTLAEKLTNSQFGFYGEIDEDGLFHTLALTGPGWDARRVPDTDAEKMLINMKIHGIYGAILKGASQIINDPDSHPDKIGLPEGHPPLNTFLGVPLKRAGKTIGMIALSNKESDYNLYDQKAIESISVAVVEAVEGVRARLALRDSRARLNESFKMASLGQQTAVAFHELLNPVNIISSHIQLLLMEAEKGSKSEEDLNSVQEEIKRIVKIADGLMRYSRKGEHEVEKVEINDLIERTIAIVEPGIKLNNIKFVRKLDDRLTTIIGSGDELRQVFLNMITNARDSMPEGGTLTVTTEEITKEKVCFIRIILTDTGCGINANKMKNIFKAFFTTKEVGKGTGLGLSISRGIIENHEGTIKVESEEGKGTTFIIDLPVKHCK